MPEGGLVPAGGMRRYGHSGDGGADAADTRSFGRSWAPVVIEVCRSLFCLLAVN